MYQVKTFLETHPKFVEIVPYRRGAAFFNVDSSRSQILNGTTFKNSFHIRDSVNTMFYYHNILLM